MLLTLFVSLAGALAVAASLVVLAGCAGWQVHRMRWRGRYSPLTEDLLRLPGHSSRREADELRDRLVELYLRFLVMAVRAMRACTSTAAPCASRTA